MRNDRRAWVGLVVLAVLAASAAVGRAETVKEPGFELTLPAGFVASPPAFVATIRSQLEGQVSPIPGASIRLEDAKIWAYERPTGAGLPDRALLVWFPGDAPPADEPTFRSGLREGLARAQGPTGVEFEAIVDRALAGDVAALECRARFPTAGSRMRMLIVPRAGFVLMLQFLRFTADAGGDEAAWDALVAGLRTTAGAPPPARRSGPSRFLQFLVGSAALLVGGIVVAAVRSRGRPLPPTGPSPEDDDPEFRPRPPPDTPR